MDNILESLKDARKLISEGDDSELAKKAFDFMKQKSDKFTKEGWQEVVDAKRGIGIPLSKWLSVEKLVKQMYGTVKEEDELDEEKQNAWDVFKGSKKIDTVFYNKGIPADEVKTSLINHDGYPSDIVVKGREMKEEEELDENKITDILGKVKAKLNSKEFTDKLEQLLGSATTAPNEEELDEAEKSKKLDWGFDLTDISAEKWSELVKLLGLKCMLTDTRWAQKSNPSKWWEWKGTGIIINTSNNPITGREANRRREDEKGYAGYIGITGDTDLVMKAKTFIKKNAESIKDESKKERSYI